MQGNNYSEIGTKMITEYDRNNKVYTLRNLPKNVRYSEKMLELLEDGKLEVVGYADCYSIEQYKIPLAHNLYWNLEPTVQMLSPNGEWIALFFSRIAGKRKKEEESVEDKEPQKIILALADENFVFEQAYRRFVEPLGFDAEDTKAFFGERLVEYCSDRADKAKASKIDAEVKRLVAEFNIDEELARQLFEKNRQAANNLTSTTKAQKQKSELAA